jgi:hypothetical protein
MEYVSKVIALSVIRLKWKERKKEMGEAEVAAVLLRLWGHD